MTPAAAAAAQYELALISLALRELVAIRERRSREAFVLAYARHLLEKRGKEEVR